MSDNEQRYREALLRIEAFSIGVRRATKNSAANRETAQQLFDEMGEIIILIDKVLRPPEAMPARNPKPFTRVPNRAGLPTQK